MNNLDYLSALNKKIIILEVIEKLRSCGNLWSKIRPYQFQSEVEQDGDFWVLTMTRNHITGRIIMDFSKNDEYYYSIDSVLEDFLLDFYREIDEEDELKIDKEILNHVSSIKGCNE